MRKLRGALMNQWIWESRSNLRINELSAQSWMCPTSPVFISAECSSPASPNRLKRHYSWKYTLRKMFSLLSICLSVCACLQITRLSISVSVYLSVNLSSIVSLCLYLPFLWRHMSPCIRVCLCFSLPIGRFSDLTDISFTLCRPPLQL